MAHRLACDAARHRQSCAGPVAHRPRGDNGPRHQWQWQGRRHARHGPDVFAGVILYTRCDCNGRTRKAEIRSPRAPGDEHWNSFGSSLALDHEGTLLVVGDPGDHSAAGSTAPNPGDRSAPRSGAMHIYTTQDGGVSWWRHAFLKSSTAPTEDHLGGDVRLSGDGRLLSSSACGLDGNSPGVRRNHAAGTGIDWPSQNVRCHLRANYVFQRSESGTWTHVAAAIVSAPPNSERLFQNPWRPPPGVDRNLKRWRVK